MGSGGSKQDSSTRTGNTTEDSNQGQQQKLPGHANPPKGLPRPQPSGKGQNESGEVKKNGTGSRDSQNDHTASSNGTKEEAVRPTTREVKRPQDNGRKSALATRRDTKAIVRQMEMGIENDEDVDNILGLDRMKTKMFLKREKTKLRREEHRKKPVNKFQAAASKLQTGGKKRDGPRTQQDEIYMGNVTLQCPSTVKIVRIFTSSTFTDTKHERNSLMENAYPQIKSFCQQLSYDFQVVDMRWGIRDEASDDLMGTEICLRELRMCQRLSTGPNFVSLMSHKYGYTDFPRCIDANEYETILKKVESKELIDLFKKWYTKDTNAVPAVYVSHPVSFNIPDYVSKDKEKKNDAKKQWWAESGKIQSTLEDVAQQVFDVQTARKYIRSVTETEVFNGLLNSKNPTKECLWLKRTVEDIEEQDSSLLLSRYMECTYNNSEAKTQKVRSMLSQVKTDITKKLDKNIVEYKVKWDKTKGINPDDKQHKTYLSQLNKDFVQKMCAMIQDAVKAKGSSEDPVIEEIVQHTQFCQEKCRSFHGRDDLLNQIQTYIKRMSNEPLVLYGPSGCGKTSVMAKTAWNCLDWTQKKAAVVLRFIGTTPKSSNLIELLSSITTQIRKAYGMDTPVSKDLRALTDEFQISLFMASSEQPLILILDSLDMLDPSYNARQLSWLPTRLRPNVKIIVSTLPEHEFEAFPALRSTMKTPENFIKVPTLTNTDLSDIVDKWLELKHRRLTPEQKKILLHMSNKCPLPLFLKLSFNKAVMWTSFVSGNSTVLEPTIRQCIDALFQRLEKMHGQIFVSRALGYLTLAKSGLTETELEDVLSCDDDVLNDVYMYWTPPIRRLPPLLLVRLRADLNQYLADRGADGVRVMYWYHRQFIESAQAKYCSDDNTNKKLHTALADFFSGTWANGKPKPYTAPDGQKESADRHVAEQSNKFGKSYNLRKLNNLPYHRCLAGQCEALKDECLCNFQFLLDKLNATSLWQLMDDFTMAKQQFPTDDLLVSINDVLHLAQTGLLYDPNQLIPQMLGRLPKNKSTQSFLDKCRTVGVPSLLPDKSILIQPGGQLIHSMAGHKGDILSLDLTADSKTALTCSDDGSIRLWNIESGQQKQCFDGLGKVSRARFCHNDEYIIIDMNKKLTIRAARTGEKIHDINSVTDDFPSCLCGDRRSLLVVFKQHSALVYKLDDVSLQFSLDCSDEIEFLFPGIAVGSKNYAVVTTSDQIYLTVLDLKKQQFSPLFRGFEPFNDEELHVQPMLDLGEEIQYEIDEVVITRDEKFVIYSNIYTNDIVFLDFHAKKKTNIIKGNPNDYMRSLKQSNDGNTLYFVKGPSVNFYDLKSSKTSVELKHPVDVMDACTNDMKTIVTSSEDSNVRVWDRTKAPQNISTASSSTTHKIRMMITLPNSRYIVAFGFKTSDAASQILFVYDVFKHVTVRERSLDCSILHMELLNEEELLVVHDVIQQIKVINLDTLTVTREFQGYLPSRKMAFSLIKTRGEVACLSFGQHNVKLYNIQTGKVSTVLETKQQGKLDGFCISDNGQTLVAWCDDASVLFVFGVPQKKLLHKIQPDLTSMFDEDQVSLTFDGKFVLFKVEGVPSKSKKEVDTVYIEVWDVQKGKKVHELLDIEYYNKYITEKGRSELSSSADTFVMLSDSNVLVANDDYILRVFDIKSGKLLHRLLGHTTGTEIVYSPENPYILTFGSWTEEMSLRLWNKDDFSCIASFTMDETITNLRYSADNKFLLATMGKPVEIVTWRLHNFKQDLIINEAKYPEIFKGTDTKGDLDLVPEEDGLRLDPNDPDKDMEAQSSDDDDDFV